jgi:hypothetical protein
LRSSQLKALVSSYTVSLRGYLPQTTMKYIFVEVSALSPKLYRVHITSQCLSSYLFLSLHCPQYGLYGHGCAAPVLALLRPPKLTHDLLSVLFSGTTSVTSSATSQHQTTRDIWRRIYKILRTRGLVLGHLMSISFKTERLHCRLQLLRNSL